MRIPLLRVTAAGIGLATFSVAGAYGESATSAQTPPALPAQAAVPSPSVTLLPPVDVTEEKPRDEKRGRKITSHKATNAPSSAKTDASATPPSGSHADPFALQAASFNDARKALYTQAGTNVTSFGAEAIQAMPQGDQAPVDKVLLQAPGVTQDSAASGALHVRNEHANLQYRINGILLPDGVSGFADVLETSFIGNLSLVTGVLPAEYGLRTSGLIDITTKQGAQEPGGTYGIYAGSRGTFTPSFEYGGSSGAVDYFFTARYLMNDIGIENPAPRWDATARAPLLSLCRR